MKIITLTMIIGEVPIIFVCRTSTSDTWRSCTSRPNQFYSPQNAKQVTPRFIWFHENQDPVGEPRTKTLPCDRKNNHDSGKLCALPCTVQSIPCCNTSLRSQHLPAQRWELIRGNKNEDGRRWSIQKPEIYLTICIQDWSDGFLNFCNKVRQGEWSDHEIDKNMITRAISSNQ